MLTDVAALALALLAVWFSASGNLNQDIRLLPARDLQPWPMASRCGDSLLIFYEATSAGIAAADSGRLGDRICHGGLLVNLASARSCMAGTRLTSTFAVSGCMYGDALGSAAAPRCGATLPCAAGTPIRSSA